MPTRSLQRLFKPLERIKFVALISQVTGISELHVTFFNAAGACERKTGFQNLSGLKSLKKV